MDLYPAIDLRGGRCVRLYQGDFDRETVYDDDPVARAKAFEAAGAPWIHVADLDAARRQGSNRETVQAIAAAVTVPVQTGGGVRDGSLLAGGVARVVLGSVAASDPEAAAGVVADHPGKVAIGLDHRAGEVQVRGWEHGSGRDVVELAAWFAPHRPAAFIVTDIGRDGTLAGPDTDVLARVIALSDVPVIASGGVGSLDDLALLATTGAAGVIAGRAIYEGKFTVEEAVAACAR